MVGSPYLQETQLIWDMRHYLYLCVKYRAKKYYRDIMKSLLSIFLSSSTFEKSRTKHLKFLFLVGWFFSASLPPRIGFASLFLQFFFPSRYTAYRTWIYFTFAVSYSSHIHTHMQFTILISLLDADECLVDIMSRLWCVYITIVILAQQIHVLIGYLSSFRCFMVYLVLWWLTNACLHKYLLVVIIL